jgi:hypothetical protein
MDEVLARARGMGVLRDMVDVVARARAIEDAICRVNRDSGGRTGGANAIRGRIRLSQSERQGRSYLIGDEERGATLTPSHEVCAASIRP